MADKQAVQAFLMKSKGLLKRKSPTILTVVGAVGVIATSVATAKATPKAMQLLETAKEENGEDLTKLEKVKVAGPAYIPAIAIGTATIACVFGSNILNKRQQTALISAYTVLDKSYKEYRDEVKKLYGETTDEIVRHEIAKEKFKENPKPVGEYDKASNADVRLFFDQYSNRYFWRTLEEVKDAEYHFNRNLALRGFAELNELYLFLGLEPTAYGYEVGWSLAAGETSYGYNWVDFRHKYNETDDLDVPSYFTIEMPFGPHADFMDY